MDGTPRDLNDGKLKSVALKRSDDEAAHDDRPEPESPIPLPDGVEHVDTFEPVEDDEDFIHPDDKDAEYGDGYNYEVLELPFPTDEEEVDE